MKVELENGERTTLYHVVNPFGIRLLSDARSPLWKICYLCFKISAFQILASKDFVDVERESESQSSLCTASVQTSIKG